MNDAEFIAECAFAKVVETPTLLVGGERAGRCVRPRQARVRPSPSRALRTRSRFAVYLRGLICRYSVLNFSKWKPPVTGTPRGGFVARFPARATRAGFLSVMPVRLAGPSYLNSATIARLATSQAEEDTFWRKCRHCQAKGHFKRANNADEHHGLPSSQMSN